MKNINVTLLIEIKQTISASSSWYPFSSEVNLKLKGGENSLHWKANMLNLFSM